MRILGFDGFNWANADGTSIAGYWFHLPEETMLVNSVEPQILTRSGTTPTFGPSIVGGMWLQGGFGYGPPGVLTAEAAFLNLWKRLNPANTNPRQLRASRNDNVVLNILAVLQIPLFSSSAEVNFKNAAFICVSPFWSTAEYTTGTGGFQ